jgi:hypothetical protein
VSRLFEITLHPQSTHLEKGSGEKAPGAGGKQKPWLVSNFRFNLGGVDIAKVTKVDSFTIKQQVTDGEVGEDRIPTPVLGQIDVSDLVLTLPDSNAAAFYKWFDAVIQGNSEPQFGTIEVLSANLKTVVFTVELKGLGLHSLAPESTDVGTVAMVVARMFCEEARVIFS